ncbi:MAG: lysozyme inhibitor LprI family protein [Gammaproteobacteria bacterium]|nr:lysozyme inhibitor LprI family protein [Gammaproteobacteria bacterium]
MGLILKIAAGIIIGSLVLQLMFYKSVDDTHEEMSENIYRQQELRNKFIVLTNSLYGYYRKNKKLPEFISDLSCVDVFNNRQKIACASRMSNGVFYVNNNNDWASAEPYILDAQLYNKCASSIDISIAGDRYRDCAKLDVSAVPDNMTPFFDCNTATDNVDRMICASDRLIEADVNLSLAYKKLLAGSADSEKQEIRENQRDFSELRRNKCDTSKCVEEMTLKKLSRLNYLGI